MTKSPVNLFARRKIQMGDMALTAAALVPASSFGATNASKKVGDTNIKRVHFSNDGIKMAGSI